MFFTKKFIPLIAKPTRITDHSKTLIDHILTNASIFQVKAGIALCDISHHLPVFCIVRTMEKRLYRNYKQFKKRFIFK